MESVERKGKRTDLGLRGRDRRHRHTAGLRHCHRRGRDQDHRDWQGLGSLALGEETSSTVPQWVDYTATATVRVVGSADAIYTYVVADFKNAANGFTWVTFSDKTPTQLTQIAKQKLTVVGIDGEESTSDAMWQGAAYYNGYVYAVVKEARAMDDSTFGVGTSLYRFKVNKGETPDKTTFGDIEFIGFTAGVELGNMGFDYNTGRMYAVDLTNLGLAIVDLDTRRDRPARHLLRRDRRPGDHPRP